MKRNQSSIHYVHKSKLRLDSYATRNSTNSFIGVFSPYLFPRHLIFSLNMETYDFETGRILFVLNSSTL